MREYIQKIVVSVRAVNISNNFSCQGCSKQLRRLSPCSKWENPLSGFVGFLSQSGSSTTFPNRLTTCWNVIVVAVPVQDRKPSVSVVGPLTCASQSACKHATPCRDPDHRTIPRCPPGIDQSVSGSGTWRLGVETPRFAGAAGWSCRQCGYQSVRRLSSGWTRS